MKDARIIAEIERRKAMKDSIFEMDAVPTTQLIWEGDLCSIQFAGIEQSQITSIEQVKNREWLITYKEAY